MIFRIVFGVILLVSNMIFTQEFNPKINYEGKDFSKLKHTWKAQWITHPSASVLDYSVFNFRRIFELDTLPKKFIVYVSADNRYRLFVNGMQVSFGPSAGDLEHYRFETINIAPYLKEGKNVIASEVVNFGEFRRAAQQSFMTAFILQSDKKAPVQINTGDGKWKVKKNFAYNYIPFNSDSVRGYYAAGPGDNVKFDKYPWGWETLDYNDSSWLKPRLANIEFAVGRGFLYGSVWYLVPREIPSMESDEKRFAEIVRTKNCRGEESFLRGKGKIVIPPNTVASILVDNKVHTVGFPELFLSGGKGSKVKITYSEALVYKDAYTDKFVNGNLPETDVKGNRNETAGKKIFGIYDILFPDGGNHRKFRPLWIRTFRFIQIDVVTKSQELVLDDFKFEYSAYPFKEKANFVSDMPLLSKMWEVAWRTLRNGSGEFFRDSPYYEQLQYVGDARLESLISIYVSGDDRLMRKAIKSFDDSRMPNGLTQSRYPSYINQVIPTYSLLWISMVHDYYLYRNDDNFVREFLPGIRGVLEWFENKMDSSGMPTNLTWWNFTDWVQQFPNGIPPGADDGYSANVSLQFVYGMQKAVELFKYFGWGYEARKYSRLASHVKKSVYESCFDSARGLFAETPRKKMFTQHTNIWAVLTDAVSPSVQKKIMKKILREKDVVVTSVYFKFYLFRALQKVGMGEEYFTQLTPWKKMLDAGLTTFAETDKNPRSDCHAWSATPCFDLLHLVAGIYPAKHGFKEVRIEPNFGPLKKMDVKFPHPYGIIRLKLRREKEKINGEITLPKKLTGEFIWHGITLKLKSGKQKITLK